MNMCAEKVLNFYLRKYDQKLINVLCIIYGCMYKTDQSVKA